MPFESAPPKHAQVVAGLQERILNCTYPAGSMLPSEEQLVNEWDMSRTTVIRALQILSRDGWIKSQQGKGRFVRADPLRWISGSALAGTRWSRARPAVADTSSLPIQSLRH